MLFNLTGISLSKDGSLVTVVVNYAFQPTRGKPLPQLILWLSWDPAASAYRGACAYAVPNSLGVSGPLAANYSVGPDRTAFGETIYGRQRVGLFRLSYQAPSLYETREVYDFSTKDIRKGTCTASALQVYIAPSVALSVLGGAPGRDSMVLSGNGLSLANFAAASGTITMTTLPRLGWVPDSTPA